MNSTQLKYALERAAVIYNKRYAALTEKYTTPAVVLSPEDRLTALKAGDFTAHDGGRYDRRDQKGWYWLELIERYISFPTEAPAVVDPKLFVEQAKLTKEHERLKDLLHLGEVSEALRLLEAFAADSAVE